MSGISVRIVLEAVLTRDRRLNWTSSEAVPGPECPGYDLRSPPPVNAASRLESSHSKWHEAVGGQSGRRDFPCLYFILEIVGVERVEATVRCFRLRIHQESNPFAFRAGKRDIVREVISHPVHFPGAE